MSLSNWPIFNQDVRTHAMGCKRDLTNSTMLKGVVLECTLVLICNPTKGVVLLPENVHCYSFTILQYNPNYAE